MKFKIEQIAICPPTAKKAIDFLRDIGLEQWVTDRVAAVGTVDGDPAENVANLAFNYDAASPDGRLEFEVLEYTEGANWMDRRPFSVSHLGMHCTAEELVQWKQKMAEHGVAIAQEVKTQSHTNPAIADSRRYHYTIFSTRYILGVDLKFIVRLPA